MSKIQVTFIIRVVALYLNSKQWFFWSSVKNKCFLNCCPLNKKDSLFAVILFHRAHHFGMRQWAPAYKCICSANSRIPCFRHAKSSSHGTSLRYCGMCLNLNLVCDNSRTGTKVPVHLCSRYTVGLHNLFRTAQLKRHLNVYLFY